MGKVIFRSSWFNDFILLSFFPVVMIYMLLQFSGYRFELLGIYVRIALIYCALRSLTHVSNSIVCSFLILYILYCAFSIIFVLNSAVKLSGYFYDLQNFLLPMMAFFIGADKRNVDNKYYDCFLFSVLFCFGLGLFFYLFSTNWYVERISLISRDLIGTELMDLDQLHASVRFSSFMYGPYPIQYLGIPALSYLLYLMNIQTSGYKSRLFNIVSLIVIILSIILCQQRAAWGYMVILLAFYLFFASGRKKAVWIYVLGGILLVLATGVLSSGDDVIGSVLSSRMDDMSFNKALSGRGGQYESLWNNWTNPFWGHGMGSGGAIARIAGLPGASDANYMKILFENGLVGSCLFLGIIIPTLVKIINNNKRYYIELHIIVFFLFAMIGSNSLCISLYYSVIFWFAIGRVWNNNYIMNTVNN